MHAHRKGDKRTFVLSHFGRTSFSIVANSLYGLMKEFSIQQKCIMRIPAAQLSAFMGSSWNEIECDVHKSMSHHYHNKYPGRNRITDEKKQWIILHKLYSLIVIKLQAKKLLHTPRRIYSHQGWLKGHMEWKCIRKIWILSKNHHILCSTMTKSIGFKFIH